MNASLTRQTAVRVAYNTQRISTEQATAVMPRCATCRAENEVHQGASTGSSSGSAGCWRHRLPQAVIRDHPPVRNALADRWRVTAIEGAGMTYGGAYDGHLPPPRPTARC